MSDSPITRSVVLANGAHVPLDSAARCLGLLADHLANPNLEWDGVYFLREVCLGRPIEPEQTQTLVREQLLTPDGTADPVMQAVVLAAVRGAGRVLHIGSPFTDPLDRSIAEFLVARDHIRSYMDEPEARAVFAVDPVEQSFKLLRKHKKWTERGDDRPPPPDDFPPR